MRMRPGLEVIRLGFRGRGQVTHFRDGLCEVLWQRGAKRALHPQSDLVWCGLTVHTCDGRPGRVVALGYEKIQVRLANRACHWMRADELAPRQPKQEVDEAPCLLR